MNKFCVYTAIIGEPDILPVSQVIGDFDYICFTNVADQLKDKSPWKLINIDEKYTDDHANRLASKYYKTHPHEFVSDYDYSLWLDGNAVTLKNPKVAADKFLSTNDMAMFIHPNLYGGLCKEVSTCLALKLGNPDDLNRQLHDYTVAGIDIHNRLWMGGYLLRRHNEKDVIGLNELWWRDIHRYSLRDQISLAAVINYTNFPVKTIMEKFGEYFGVGVHFKRNRS